MKRNIIALAILILGNFGLFGVKYSEKFLNAMRLKGYYETMPYQQFNLQELKKRENAYNQARAALTKEEQEELDKMHFNY
ncbi:hypothetical protein M1446_04525 [Candidatus Dependentiae bacterium]|nr:hypothetical protein [Candidatus Dependentiae bacterium]